MVCILQSPFCIDRCRISFTQREISLTFTLQVNFLSKVTLDLACPIYTETTKAISIQYTEKKHLIRDLSGLCQITCEALSERKSSQVIVKGHYTNILLKLNRFNVGLFNKIKKKQERDAALWENTKLMNSVAEESRKLKSIQMKLKRLQANVSNNYKVTDFYFIY